MGSLEKSQSLPIIDITSYLSDHDPEGRLSTSSAIHSACLKHGFFYLRINNFADPSEPEDLTKLAREFFALPEDEKAKIAFQNEDGARGYARLKENVTNGKADNHEAIDFYRPVDNPDKTRSLWGENQWPTVPGFKEKYEAWVEKMKALGLIVMEAMANGLGMTPEEWEGLRAQVDRSFWVMRVIGYPPLPDDHDGFSCGAHKDYGCLTFLYADPTRSALQVLSKNTSGANQAVDKLPVETGAEVGTWINADPIEGCVVVNIGEMWEVWTNGLYKSTLHRVVHRGSNYRIPFFFEPNFDAKVEVLAAARRLQSGQPKGEESDKKYDSVVYGEFLLKKVGGNFAEGKGKYD
ncbi:Clavaminate synthase-like protein [Athelia psychrophila]|uniref:Clavaminate synthase-like protein n=1 Tax=Athelia psychrophila TaxID=1759441 RepID=A0A166WCE7_9AGAM|nr:Clavaminate synthase-like protein [Fibularhizoctonia sp. CBS 109695]